MRPPPRRREAVGPSIRSFIRRPALAADFQIFITDDGK